MFVMSKYPSNAVFWYLLSQFCGLFSFTRFYLWESTGHLEALISFYQTNVFIPRIHVSETDVYHHSSSNAPTIW